MYSMDIQQSNVIQDGMIIEQQAQCSIGFPSLPTSTKRTANTSWISEIPSPKKRRDNDDTHTHHTYITLAFKDWTDNDLLHKIHLFKINEKTKLDELFTYYANGRGIGNDVKWFNFYFKDTVLKWSDTIFSCGITDNDVIDCMRRKTFQ